MFRPARLRLTIIYSIVFFGIFWLFSGGLYLWMDHSFGEGYISKVNSKQVEQGTSIELSNEAGKTALIAGDIALDQLKYTLIVLNLVLVALVPGLAWLLTSRTLRPIEESYAKQRQFVSDASHELRTPLTIMQGELEVTLKQVRKPAEYQTALISTREEVARLHSLTEALLFIARGDQNNLHQHHDTVDIIDTISEVLSRLESLAMAKGLSVMFEPPAEKLEVVGSSEMLHQLFTNLVENAIKFTPAQGEIVVSAKLVDPDIYIFVRDTGTGMDAKDVTQVFERFYRADESRQQAGFGLGLAICKTIVEQHSGTIAVSSVLGKGTTVTVILPRV